MEEIIRDLDGYYFRIKRNEKWQNICFTDMTRAEALGVMEGRSDEWLNSLYDGLIKLLQELGALVNDVRLDVIIEEVIEDGIKHTIKGKIIDAHTTIRNIADYYDITSKE